MQDGEVYCQSWRCAEDGSLLCALLMYCFPDGSRPCGLLMGAAEAGGHRGTVGGLGHERHRQSTHLTILTRRGRQQSAHLTSPMRRGGDGFMFGIMDGMEMSSGVGSWPARRWLQLDQRRTVCVLCAPTMEVGWRQLFLDGGSTYSDFTLLAGRWRLRTRQHLSAPTTDGVVTPLALLLRPPLQLVQESRGTSA
jgi:hypothetical protein